MYLVERYLVRVNRFISIDRDGLDIIFYYVIEDVLPSGGSEFVG
jgi:hypothetical protein